MNTTTTEHEDVTFMWTDEQKHALATVVSLVAAHASPRESAEWSALWQHFQTTLAQCDELLTALKWIKDKFTAEGGSAFTDAVQVIWHCEAAIDKVERLSTQEGQGI